MTGAVLGALVLLPAVVGAALLAAGCRGPAGRGRLPAALAVGTAAVTLGLSLVCAFARPQIDAAFMAGSSFGLGVDALSALLLPTVAAVTLLVLVFASGDVVEGQARFHGLMLLFAAAALLTVAATTLPVLLLAWEVMGATSYALVGFWWRQPHRVSSGLVAFLTTRSADLGLYLAGGAALAGGAGLGLSELAGASSGWRVVIAVGIAVAALGKAAQLPFSPWLSRAMDGPSPVSALLHSAAMVAMGGYLLLRVHPLLAAAGWPATAVAWAGALTALLMGAVAVAQSDLKQLLAASTSAQLGFVVLAAGVGNVGGGAAHLVAHAATKALLFLVAGAWLGALGTKQLETLRGAARRWPVVGVAASVGLLSLAGVAPLSLWATKDEVLAAVLDSSPALYAVALAAAAVSAAYAAKVLVVMWRRPTTSTEAGLDAEEPGSRHVNALQQAPLVVLAVGAAVLGLLALPPVSGILGRGLGEGSAASPGVAQLVGSAVLALVVLVVVTRVSLPAPRALREWWGIEAATRVVVVAPALALARSLARFDDRVLDRLVWLLADGVRAGARRLGALDVQVVDGAVEALATGTRRLGRLATRPQTGQLHEYYVQAVVLVAAAFLLLVLVK